MSRLVASNYEVNIKLNTKTVNKQLNNLEKRISKLNKLAQGGKANRAVNRQEKERLLEATKRTRQEEKTLRVKQKQLKVDQQQLKVLQQQGNTRNRQASGSGGTGITRGAARGGGGASSALISGAFPLLFGQGPFAALGGATGGFLGDKIGGQMGGFAGGLVGTTIATGIQSLIGNIKDLGAALDPANVNIDQTIEKLGIINNARAAEIKLIEKFQGEQAALAEITKDTAKIIGKDGVRALKEFAENMKAITDPFTNIFLNAKAELAKLFNLVANAGNIDLTKAKQNLGGNKDPLVEALANTINARNQLGMQANEFTKPVDSSLFGMFSHGVSGFNNYTGDIPTFELNEAGEAEKLRLANLRKTLELAIKIKSAQGEGARIVEKISADYKTLVGDIEGQLGVEMEILELRKTGLNPALAKQILMIEKAGQNQLFVIEEQIRSVDELIQAEKEKEIIDAATLIILETEKQSLEGSLQTTLELLEADKQRVIQQSRLARAAKATQDSFDALRQTVATDLADGIQGLIRGTNTLNQVMNNVLDKMIDAAFNMAFFGNAGGSLIPGSGLFGSIFRANGGPVKGGNSYVVGERGPEMFTPGVSGTITPNHALGGSTTVVVNVDASGSNVQGDEEQGRELGRLISVAVQSEILQQKRPGGLLA